MRRMHAVNVECFHLQPEVPPATGGAPPSERRRAHRLARLTERMASSIQLASNTAVKNGTLVEGLLPSPPPLELFFWGGWR